MKDLNELMQAILDMDAAQRKATANAMEQRTAKQARLEEEKQAIADEYAAQAQAAGQAAAQAAETANAAALKALQAAQAQAAQTLEASVAANRAAWVQTLCERALAQSEEVTSDAAAQ